MRKRNSFILLSLFVVFVGVLLFSPGIAKATPSNSGPKSFAVFDPNGTEILELASGLNLVKFQSNPQTAIYTSFELIRHFAEYGHLISTHSHPLFFIDPFGASIPSYLFFSKCCGNDFMILNDQIYLLYNQGAPLLITPVADAGEDLAVLINSMVTLNGTGSYRFPEINLQ